MSGLQDLDEIAAQATVLGQASVTAKRGFNAINMAVTDERNVLPFVGFTTDNTL